MTNPLPPLVDTTPTRRTLHDLAEHVLAAEQTAANGDYRLQAGPDGFATGWFSAADQPPRRVRVAGDQLVHETQDGSVAEAIRGDFDSTAASVLYAWWDLGTRVLTHVQRDLGSRSSDVVLYPEHFDIGSTVDLGEARKLNLGFSPGDDFSPVPYVYAGPWEHRDGPFWNAPFGAYRRYDEIDAADPDRATRAFLDEAISLIEQRDVEGS
jgi:hypothetical protein